MFQKDQGIPLMPFSRLAAPPEGTVLRSAVLTTFDLDLSVLSDLPENSPHAGGILVFYGDGRFRDGTAETSRRDLYRDWLIPVIFPSGADGWPRAHAHGKIWLFEYAAPSGESRWRLSVHSLNLWPDENLENQVVFSGAETGAPQPKTKPLIDYLAVLETFLTEDVPDQAGKLSLLRRLEAALSTVRFEPLAPWICEDWELIGPGMNRAAFLRKRWEEMLIICQRIQPGGLSMIHQASGAEVKSITVSNLSTIRDLLAEGPTSTVLIPRGEDGKYIHAKIFLLRRGDRWDLYCGSMNLTAFAVSRNLECMVHLINPGFVRSAESFLAGFLGIPEREILQLPGLAAPPDSIDSPVFRDALSLPVRYRVLHRLIREKQLASADCSRIIAHVLSPACTEDLRRLFCFDGLPSVPRLRKTAVGGKTREIYALPLRERVLLSLVGQALHRYDDCFSPCLYSHIRGREPIYALTRIREMPDFGELYLFRTDIRNFGAGMDAELLLQSIRSLPGMDPVFCSFAGRMLSRREYSLAGVPHTDGPAVQPGNALCGFFENVYLRDLDTRMENRAAFYARCADDILIGARTMEEVQQLAEEVRQAVKDHKLQLQESKTMIMPPGASFSFLGWQISGRKIDFRPEELRRLRHRLRREAGRLIRECRLRELPAAFRPVMIIPFVNQLISRLGIQESFRVVSVPDGLREIDRMLCDLIRAVVSGKTGNARYRISREEIRKWGYRSLVNRWYRHTAGKKEA